MSALAMTASGDLSTSGGLTLLTDLSAETAQRLKIKFRFFKGEGLLDTRSGMPLFEKVLVKDPNIPEVKRLYREVLLADPAVASVTSLDLVYTRGTRTLDLSFEAALTDGTSLIFEDFILVENV